MPDFKMLSQKIDELKDEYLQFLIDICNIESPTTDKKAVDAVGQYVIDKAKKRGWKTEVQKQSVSGDCICITMNDSSAENPIVFSAHMDTVHAVGSFGIPAVKLDGEKIIAPGVKDCKGGISASFHAMAALEALGFNKRPVKLILQSDEENSSITSGKSTVKFMAEQAKDCIAFLNLEGSDGNSAVIERKGICRYIFEITGKASHSSYCYSGANAICEAAYKIIELEKMKDKDGLTCNCGIINGGTVANTVADKCTFVADIRFKTEAQRKQAEATVSELCNKSFVSGTKCSVTLKSERCAMEKNDRNVLLLQKINEILKNCGFPELNPEFENSGSDAADMTNYGLPCVDKLGIYGGNIHQLDEFAYISSVADTAKKLAAIALYI